MAAVGNTKRVFVTNVTYIGGALGGVAGADAKCSLAASAAGLPGTFKAWISDGTTNAIDRIADVGPWVRPDGMIAFNNKANLMTGPIVGISYNENGVLSTTAGVAWTGTIVGGTTSTSRCADWTSTASTATTGYVNSSDGQWTAGLDSHDTSCAVPFRLYCFGQ